MLFFLLFMNFDDVFFYLFLATPPIYTLFTSTTVFRSNLKKSLSLLSNPRQIEVEMGYKFESQKKGTNESSNKDKAKTRKQ